MLKKDKTDEGRSKQSEGDRLSLCKDCLDELLTRVTPEDFLENDPVSFVHHARPEDREIVGLIASSLAYGNVKSVLSSIWRVLDRLGSSPSNFIKNAAERRDIKTCLKGFRHRFTSGDDLSCLLFNADRVLKEHGSLGAYFASIDDPNHPTIETGAIRFAEGLRGKGGVRKGVRYLLPSPADGSACKRLMMFLRWMVRGPDGCDLGLWRDQVAPSRLVIPLDTHTARLSRLLGLSSRKTADWRMALEVTEGLRSLDPRDPVRYDFSLSHLGIERLCRDEKTESAVCAACALNQVCRRANRKRGSQ